MSLHVLDVNVLLAVHRDDHPDHPVLRPWFDGLLGRGDRFAVPSFIWASFLRLATHRRIFTVPTPRASAFAFTEAVCEQPAYVRLDPGPRHLVLLRRLCEEADAGADLVPDAALAAVALEHGADVVSLDRDFARFESIRWTRPAVTA